MLRPSPNHGTQRLLNNDDVDDHTQDFQTTSSAIACTGVSRIFVSGGGAPGRRVIFFSMLVPGSSGQRPFSNN